MNGGSERDKNIFQIPFQAYCSTMILKDIDSEIKANPKKTLQEFYTERLTRSNICERNPDLQIIGSGFVMML